MTTHTTQFSKKMFQLMDDERMTQKDLLDRLSSRYGFASSQPFLSKLNLDRKGEIWPSSQFVYHVANAFDVTPDALLLPVDLEMGKEISAMAKIMMSLDDAGRAKLLATARGMVKDQAEDRQKTLTTIDALIKLIETNGSREIKDRASEIVGRFIPSVLIA